MPSTMSRLMLGRTLERVCKAVLLLCLVHFLIMMILYFDVYSQRFDIFSRFNNGRGANASRWPHHSYYNYSSTRPNATFASYVPASEQLPLSGKPELNRTHPTPKPIPPCPEVPPGLGRCFKFDDKLEANNGSHNVSLINTSFPAKYFHTYVNTAVLYFVFFKNDNL